MEASVRILNSSAFNRHFSASLLLKPHPHLKLPHRLPNPPRRPRIAIATNPNNSLTRFHSSFPHPNSNPLGFSQFISALHASNSSLSTNSFDPFVSDLNDKFFEWNFALKGENVGVVGDNGPVVTVVLLGWLGANPKHLRRYVELYNSRGIHAVTFVASVKDVLWFDLGRKLQQRISALAQDLGSWLGESERDGRERLLIFHTFSNTGWLAYGAILDNFQGRQDVLMKIKGCVVDSGGDPEINPKV